MEQIEQIRKLFSRNDICGTLYNTRELTHAMEFLLIFSETNFVKVTKFEVLKKEYAKVVVNKCLLC